MQSDIPMGSSRDPAAVGIVLAQVPVEKAFEKYAQENVRYLPSGLDGSDFASEIQRFIDGHAAHEENAAGPKSPLMVRTDHQKLEQLVSNSKVSE
jgi:hypothetical protein